MSSVRVLSYQVVSLISVPAELLPNFEVLVTGFSVLLTPSLTTDPSHSTILLAHNSSFDLKTQ